jgi:uncharacterized DUF497 family protein
MDFEWNPAKARANVAKHGIDFPAASRTFDDPRLLGEIDPRNYGQDTELRPRDAISRDRQGWGRADFGLFTMRGGATHHQRKEGEPP